MAVEALQHDGFVLVRGVIPANFCDEVGGLLDQRFTSPNRTDTSSSSYGVRDLLNQAPEVRTLARSDAIRSLVVPVMDENARPVRGIFFDKTKAANWNLPGGLDWHGS